MAFPIYPFGSIMKSPRMSQTDTKCKSYGRFHQMADPIGKRRNTRLALNIQRPRASHWSWTCGFSDLSFRYLYDKKKMSQTDTKYESYANFHQMANVIGNRRNTGLALNFGRPRASCWSWTCGFSAYSFR